MNTEFVVNAKELKKMERVKRLKLINSISGIKSANLIGTKSKNGISNLCIISSVTHIGSNPPLIGFISRPNNKVKRDTFNNISENPYFTINSVEHSKVQNAHMTSAKYDKKISEFDKCGFKEIYIKDFPIPFVSSSRLKIGLKLMQKLKLINGTYFIIGQIEILNMPLHDVDKIMKKNIGVVGLNTYYSIKKIKEFDYVRLNEKSSNGH
tara:strand:+ start:1041 stop:1667 length:627 start_codon:yes stop_codon:yes gene_type:complete